MASRYLLVEFDDEQTALKLKEKLDGLSRADRPVRVVGLFAKPTKYCECDPARQVTTRSGESNTRRGAKFGWWVCMDCKRPTSALSGLRNLLKPDDIISPPSWTLRGERWTHYVSSLSGLVLGQRGRDFWNAR